MDHELNIALKESERHASEKAYFDARPNLEKSELTTHCFRAGFDRAWDILHTGRKTNGKLLPPAPFVQMDHPFQVPDCIEKISSLESKY